MAWLRQARLILEDGPSNGREYTLADFPAVIGRLSAADVPLNDPRISREHALIHYEGDRYLIEDLGSSNGTFVNGQRLAGRLPLQEGDHVMLGHAFCFRFSSLAPGPASTSLQSDVTGDAHAARITSTSIEGDEGCPARRLVITLSGGIVKEHFLTAPEITLGRDASNDIVIDSPIVSRRHARLVRDGFDYVLHVLPEAKNPVRLGDQIVTTHCLTSGGELAIGSELGQYTVTICYE